jgi:hypothetical protein
MRSLRTALLGGSAALAVAGFAGIAAAQAPATNVLTVTLPQGGVAHIRYAGDVAPQVTVAMGPATPAVLAPLPAMFGPASPFATMQRISAEMDREAAAMLRRAAALAAAPWPGPGTLGEAKLRPMPPGSRSYSFVSTRWGNGVCSRSVEITSPADGGRPRVVTRSSGDCGPQTGSAGGTVALPTAPTPAHGPDLLWARGAGAHPSAGILREADWRR